MKLVEIWLFSVVNDPRVLENTWFDKIIIVHTKLFRIPDV